MNKYMVFFGFCAVTISQVLGKLLKLLKNHLDVAGSGLYMNINQQILDPCRSYTKQILFHIVLLFLLDPFFTQYD